jgi:hypothetical protein
MSYTVQKIADRAIAIINDLSDAGTVSTVDSAEALHRAPYLLDLWQKEMARSGDLYKTHEISCYRKKNLLTDVNQFQIVENNAESQVYSAKGANCFYFEVDGDCIVTIQEDGADVSGYYSFNGGANTAFTGTISITVPVGTTSFLPCRGVITPASQGTITMTFTGSYYFRHNNRALSPYKFATADKVPDFKPWYKITMPSDFKSRSQVVNEFPSWQYENDVSHKWEGNNELYVMFSYEGIIRIKYVPVPTEITSLSQTLEVDDITAVSGSYYLAWHFLLSDESTEAAAQCKAKFESLKKESLIKAPLSVSEIIDVYS